MGWKVGRTPTLAAGREGSSVAGLFHHLQFPIITSRGKISFLFPMDPRAPPLIP